jgi:uracil-DNA glycosylase family 4
MARDELERLTAEVIECRRCPRLVEWREQVGVAKRAAFRDEEYWAKPVPGFGDPAARVVVIGLAPAAHGANRTGRMFTGDKSGEWLFRSLHATGFADRPTAVARDDGLELTDCWITAPVRCAPPANRPRPEERDNCSSWFSAELDALDAPSVFVCLGQYGYESLWRHLRSRVDLPVPRPRFAHGLEVELEGGLFVLASYHVSQHNTFTGRLTESMLDAVFSRAAELAAG